MPVVGRRHLLVVLCAVALAATGCGNPASDSTTTAPATTTSPPFVVTTTQPAATTAMVGSQPLPSSGSLEPGDYHTRLFQPTTEFHVENEHFLFPNQTRTSVYLRNRVSGGNQQESSGRPPYRAVSVNSVWLGLSSDEIIEELHELERIELGQFSDVEVGGYPAHAAEGSTAADFESLWREDVYWFEPESHMRFIVVDTPAGSLIVIIAANSDVWDEFLPAAEEILGGISFPDMESG